MSASPQPRPRLVLVASMVFALLGAAPLADQGSGSLLDRPAHLSVEDVPLERALLLLQRSSGVVLAFSPDLLPRDRRVSCSCTEVKVAVALDRLLEDTGLRYRLGQRRVIIGRWKPG